MWLMLQQPAPDDYVIATGESHSVREVLDIAFATVGLYWDEYVKIDSRIDRPSEVDHLSGDPSKASAVLGWKPSMSFKELVEMMVAADCEKAELERASAAHRGTTTVSGAAQ
jgi:GDPmannose 4,6-dehydratase